jgi:hypothetical protein
MLDHMVEEEAAAFASLEERTLGDPLELKPDLIGRRGANRPAVVSGRRR